MNGIKINPKYSITDFSPLPTQFYLPRMPAYLYSHSLRLPNLDLNSATFQLKVINLQ